MAEKHTMALLKGWSGDTAVMQSAHNALAVRQSVGAAVAIDFRQLLLQLKLAAAAAAGQPGA